MGRKKATNPKGITVAYRVTMSELAYLDAAAEVERAAQMNGLVRGQWARAAAMRDAARILGKTLPEWTAEQKMRRRG
jgi:hypothetical protein